MPRTNKSSSRTNVSEAERFSAALSYVWILCLYTLVFKKDSDFIQFHAKQGLALFVLEMLALILAILAPVIWIVAVIVAIIGIKSALDGKKWKIPFVGDWIEKKGI